MIRHVFIEKVNEDKLILKDNTYKIGIVGSRTIIDKEKVLNILTGIINKFFNDKKDNLTVVSGGARGIDTFAEEFAIDNDYNLLVIKPNWKKYGRGAGFKRNSEIVKYSDSIIAIVDKLKGGTWDTIKKAKKENKDIYVYHIEKDRFINIEEMRGI